MFFLNEYFWCIKLAQKNLNFFFNFFAFLEQKTRKQVCFSTPLAMAYVNGMPVVMGGLDRFAFLKSLEFLDNTPEAGSPLGHTWRLSANELSCPRYKLNEKQQ